MKTFKTNFKCGTACNCLVDECNGNPNPKLKKEFEKFRLFDKSFLANLCEDLNALDDWTSEEISECVGVLDKTKGASINIALCGTPSNPVPIIVSLEILGKEEVIRRLSNSRNLMMKN